MKYLILILLICLCGCASVAIEYKCEKGQCEPIQKYSCRGSGCDVDFVNKTLKGGSILEMPDLTLDK